MAAKLCFSIVDTQISARQGKKWQKTGSKATSVAARLQLMNPIYRKLLN